SLGIRRSARVGVADVTRGGTSRGRRRWPQCWFCGVHRHPVRQPCRLADHMKNVPLCWKLLFLSLLCGFNSACARPERTVEVFDKDGIRFSHYSDWTITEDAPAAGTPNTRVIHIEGPDNAVLSILCIPENSPTSLEEFASSVAERRVTAIKEKLTV